MTEAPRGAEAKARSRAETRTPRWSARRRAPLARGAHAAEAWNWLGASWCSVPSRRRGETIRQGDRGPSNPRTIWLG